MDKFSDAFLIDTITDESRRNCRSISNIPRRLFISQHFRNDDISMMTGMSVNNIGIYCGMSVMSVISVKCRQYVGACEANYFSPLLLTRSDLCTFNVVVMFLFAKQHTCQ